MTGLVSFSDIHEYEEYLLTDHIHILIMLKQVLRESSTLYLFFSEGHPVPITISDIDEDGEFLLSDYSVELANIPRILTSGIFAVFDHANTQIQCHFTGLAQSVDGQGARFMLPLPDKLYFIQRRSSERFEIPRGEHIHCTIDGYTDKVPVLDLSDDGLALHDELHCFDFEKDKVLTGVVLHLPGMDIPLSLRMMNRFNIYLPPSNDQVCRVGCIISQISTEHRQQIRQYLNDLEA
ncbi:MAG: PilZ domain-containing protein [Gammaproteobacteria bacterium]|nr:PilZ domain-containing protein [Gammaproteobacteria bacterium]